MINISIIKVLMLELLFDFFCGFQTPPLPGPSPGEGDDLVFSGAGSGCDMDDEDECIPVFDGSGEDNNYHHRIAFSHCNFISDHSYLVTK